MDHMFRVGFQSAFVKVAKDENRKKATNWALAGTIPLGWLGSAIGGAIGAEEGKKLRTAVGSGLGTIAGGTLGELAGEAALLTALQKTRKPRPWLLKLPNLGFLIGSLGGSGGGAYLAHGKDEE